MATSGSNLFSQQTLQATRKPLQMRFKLTMRPGKAAQLEETMSLQCFLNFEFQA